LRVFPKILYGAGHAYGNPGTGSGTEASVGQLTRRDVRKFHQTWFKPNHCTLIIVGDATLKEITPRLEKFLGQWRAGDVPAKNIGPIQPQNKRVVYLVDRPGSLQSTIFAGNVAPPRANPDEIAIETMNNVLGGTATSRVNMNLRETRHWAYFAASFIWNARGQRPFIVYAPVQTDKTKESMVEVDKELRGILGREPVSTDELTRAQQNQTLRLPGQWETSDAVGDSIAEIVRFGLPDDYFSAYPGKVRALTVKELGKAAEIVVHPDQLIWVVVGDRAKIEPGIRELAWGDLLFLDADSFPLGDRHR